jgi:hypothetical protein
MDVFVLCSFNETNGGSMKRLWLVAAMLFVWGAFAEAKVKKGPGDTGGGDEVGLEFQASLRSSVREIREGKGRGRKEFEEIVRLDWHKSLRGIKILTTNRRLFVTSNGVKQEVVAINSRQKRIVEVNRARWKALANVRFKEAIALHEVLSLLGLEDTGLYPYSGLYLSLLFGYAPEPIFGGGPAQAVPLPSAISSVYPYRCRTRFFEGEGVSYNQLRCVPGQRLGFISAEYTFYLYRAGEKNNFASQLHENFFPAPDYCGLGRLTQHTCALPTEAEFGLSAQPEGAFVVGITLTAAPVGNGAVGNYGFAALPDSRGRCPENLVAARPYVAQPSSMIDPLPSSFLNENNSLSNTVIHTKDRGTPAPFQVWRQPNSTPCDLSGNCQWPGGMQLAQSVPYTPLTPVVCVIPKSGLPLHMRKFQ